MTDFATKRAAIFVPASLMLGSLTELAPNIGQKSQNPEIRQHTHLQFCCSQLWERQRQRYAPFNQFCCKQSPSKLRCHLFVVILPVLLQTKVAFGVVLPIMLQTKVAFGVVLIILLQTKVAFGAVLPVLLPTKVAFGSISFDGLKCIQT